MSQNPLSFQWKYIALPLAVLAIAVIIAFLYLMLPGELSYGFRAGAPEETTGRGVVLAWTLVPQFVFVLFAAGIVRGVVGFGRRLAPREGTGALPARVLFIMGNMLALPQLVLAFAMLDIFVYNSYRIHLMPIWVFALIIMALGGLLLGIFFVQALRRVSQPSKEHR
jgi:hypothetical protein